MRIGAFELDCEVYPCFMLAEVRVGQAKLFRLFRLRNVRGASSDWLRISAVVNGRRTRNKAVRGLAVGDESKAESLENEIKKSLTIPQELGPGTYSGELLIEDECGEHKIPFGFEVCGSQIIPIDFVRSPLLAAYIQESDMLRKFASDTLQDLNASGTMETIKGLYEALLDKKLRYQPPVSTKYPDCQLISDMGYILEKGGSCADLSLLFASLLWVRGLSPVLLLFADHLAAGSFVDGFLPDYETLDNPEEIMNLVLMGKLILIEPTAVCYYQQTSFERSMNRILDRIKGENTCCQLINIKRILRNGRVVTLPAQQMTIFCCPHCGYPHSSPLNPTPDKVCPACGELIREDKPADSPVFQAMPTKALYILKQGQAIFQRLLDSDAEHVQIADMYLGNTVRIIADHAMEQSKASRVLLPDSLMYIGDYSFFRCANLQFIKLETGLKVVGTGAFSGSGLKSIRIPGTVQRISRLAFSYCENLESLMIEEGVLFIDERAFYGCPKLRSVRIPASVLRIERNAFDQSCEILLSGQTIVSR